MRGLDRRARAVQRVRILGRRQQGTLRHYLGAKMAERLRYAAIVYQAMGAIRVANTIHEALAELACTPTTIQRQLLVGMLQERLLGSTDPLQDLIVRLSYRVH